MTRPLGVGLLALVACQPDPDRPAGRGDPAPVEVRGALAKGPFVRGSTVSVATLDLAGTPTGDVALTETFDDAGGFAVSVPVAGPVLIEGTGSWYDEVGGGLSAAPITLRSYASIAARGQTSNVNVFTHVVHQRVAALVAAGATVDDAVSQAEDEAWPALHVGPADLDPGAAAGAMDLFGDTVANAYLFATSTVLVQAARDRAGPDGPVDAVLTEMIDGIAADLADGTLDGGPGVPVGAELYALQATIDADAMMTRLAARFAEIGSAAVVPDLHRVFDLDLDGVVDLDDPDADGDGHVRSADGGEDCDDHDAGLHPGATEDFGDGVDVDCSSDTDGDGAVGTEDGGDDCDDGDASIRPGATETWYDGVDSDCDGASDFDQDADGVELADDCDDGDAAVHPGAVEACATAADDDCDGTPNTDDGIGCAPHHLDGDGDGYGALSSGDPRCLCFAEGGYVLDDTDCDDLAAARNPAALETCGTPYDDDCDGDATGDADGDGLADVPAAPGCVDFFVDADADGLGAGPAQCLCASSSRVPDGSDCDDANASVGGPPTWYADADGDGWGDSAEVLPACTLPAGYVAQDGDCDPYDPTQHPGAVWYRDADGDGFGDPADPIAACLWPVGTVVDATDCDDAAPDQFPGAIVFADADGDGFGDPATPVPACDPTAPSVGDGTDCDDADAASHPGAVWYADADGDGSGNPVVAVEACVAPPGYVAVGQDCDEIDPLVRETFFGPARLLAAGTAPVDSVVVDADSDGDLDVVTAGSGDDTVHGYANLGGGSFGADTAIATGIGDPHEIEAGDLDGDGDSDLVVAGDWPGELVWYEQTGAGAFTPHTVVELAHLESVTPADLDGDGDLDLATARENVSGTVSWYENLGAGAFGVEQIVTTSMSRPGFVTAADLDGDLDPDLVVAGRYDTVGWLENLGGATFGPLRVIDDASDDVRHVAAGDLDADGDVDLVAASSGDDTVALYENLGGGTFAGGLPITTTADGASSAGLADLDADGDSDLVVTSQEAHTVAWYENQGGLAFGPEQVVHRAVDGALSTATGDLDGDGNLDLVATFDTSTSWFQGLCGDAPPVVATLAADGATLENGLLRIRTTTGGILWFDFYHAGEGVWYDFRNNLNFYIRDIDGEESRTEGDEVLPEATLTREDGAGATLTLRWVFPNGTILVADATMLRGDPHVTFALRRDPASEPVAEYMWHVTFGQAEAVQTLDFDGNHVDVSGYALPLPGDRLEVQRVDRWYDVGEYEWTFRGVETAAPDPANPAWMDRVLGLEQHVTWSPMLASDSFATETRDQPWQEGWDVPAVVPWIEGLWFDRVGDLPDVDTLVYGIENAADFR